MLASCLVCPAIYGQKVVTLTSDEPYVEWLGGRPEVDDHDVCLRLSFNEYENTLSVSLNSTNSILFAFHRGVVYDNVFRGLRRLRPERLPYKVDFEPSCVFRMSKDVKRELRPGAHTHSFRVWMEYNNMEPIQSTLSLPEDSIAQTFRISTSIQDVSIRLRDIFMLDRKGSAPRQWNKYLISLYQDLHAEYNIRIVRNPCKGEEDAVVALNERHRQASHDIDNLMAAFNNGEIRSIEELENFNDMRNSLLMRHMRDNTVTNCPELAEAQASYNICVDSLLQMRFTLSDNIRSELITGFGTENERIDAEGLLFRARQLDELTAQWQLETSKSNRLSIIQQCRKIIDEAYAMVIGHRLMTDGDYRAMNIFNQAREHFLRTCK